MSSNSKAAIYLALEEHKVKWKKGLKEDYEDWGALCLGDDDESSVTRIINYDSQDEYICGVELVSVERGNIEIDLHKLASSCNAATRLLSHYVENPEDFKLTLSSEYL